MSQLVPNYVMSSDEASQPFYACSTRPQGKAWERGYLITTDLNFVATAHVRMFMHVRIFLTSRTETLMWTGPVKCCVLTL